MNLCLFDLDDTLIPLDSDHAWGDDDFSQTVFYSIPKSQTTPFYVRIFDPETFDLDFEDNSITDNMRCAYPLEAISNAFLLGLQITSPFLVYTLIANLLVGIASRLTPQVPIYFVSGPLIVAGDADGAGPAAPFAQAGGGGLGHRVGRCSTRHGHDGGLVARGGTQCKGGAQRTRSLFCHHGRVLAVEHDVVLGQGGLGAVVLHRVATGFFGGFDHEADGARDVDGVRGAADNDSHMSRQRAREEDQEAEFSRY